ncbi:hypothetical protein M3Y97_01133600 [Aphelenchoides bicaudatus]|nr:hypothetical protein M3Y97_01133600 [Aphelenchoides bicaudatus]
MGKKKAPTFPKMVCEALTTADEEKGMNSKAILNFIKEKYSINGDDKTNLNLIHQELERGKTLNEYLQVQGNSVHGHFTFNIFYVPPSEVQSDQLPDYLNPPEAPKEPVEVPLQGPKKRHKKTKAEKDQEIAASTSRTTPSSPAESPYVLLRYAPDGRVEKGTIDKQGNIKFTLYEPMPYISRDQAKLFQQKRKTQVTPEEASKLANDPLFRRVFTQTESFNIDPTLQKAADKASLKKSSNLLRGDKTDRIRLGIHSFAGGTDNNLLGEFNQMELNKVDEADEMGNLRNQLPGENSSETEIAPKTLKLLSCCLFKSINY